LIYLHKILPFFLSPLGIILISLIASFFFKRRFFVFLAFIVLVISSNPIFGNYLMKKLEYPYKPISVNLINEADAVVVLSGMINQVGDNNYYRYEFLDPDRFFGGLDLIKENKSNKIIFTAGQLPWTDNWEPEGFILKNKAISLGVSQAKILVTENVKNTYEESIAVTKLIPNNSSIILVTSAFHMHRSKYLFENQGFKVMPFPVDFKYQNINNSIIQYIPHHNALRKTSRFIRENIGRIYYKLFL
jgi:uncharacterized SAM-binding protein YcdF (DUF218 family)